MSGESERPPVDPLREALEHAHNLVEWVGTDIEYVEREQHGGEPRYRVWREATVKACDHIRAALASAAAPRPEGLTPGHEHSRDSEWCARCVEHGLWAAPRPEGLDVAWSEAVAAMPKAEGWKLRLGHHPQADDPSNRYEARVDRSVFDWDGKSKPVAVWDATPTDALRGLVARLSDTGDTSGGEA